MPKRLHQTHIERGPYLPDFLVENDLDYTSPYPCGVCGQEIRSRSLLATHAHPKKAVSR